MGATDGPYTTDSGELFDEVRQWVAMMQQKDAPILDVLWNTFMVGLYTQLRRRTQSFTGPAGTPFGTFKVIEAPVGTTTGNFAIQGALSGASGAVTDGHISTTNQQEGPARFYLGGHMALFDGDREWLDSDTLPTMHSKITTINGATSFTDTSAFFEVMGDTLVGRVCYPDITDISDDTAAGPIGWPVLEVVDTNTISLDFANPKNADGTAFTGSPAPSSLEDAGIVAGDYYRFSITTADSPSRSDTIILDIYEDEETSSDDPVLGRPIEGTVSSTMNAKKSAQRIEYLENVDLQSGSPLMGEAPYYYERRTDNDGHVHHRCILAIVSRTGGKATVETADITTYNDYDQFNLGFSNLPPTTTGSFVDGTATAAPGAAGSIGYNTGTGPWGLDTTALNVDRLLLQMLGNITDNMNSAIQNMGDYDNGTNDVAGQPGIGGGTYSSTGGHVMLATNDEQASIRQRATGDGVGWANQLQSVLAHRGFALDASAPAGTAAEHMIAGTSQASGSSANSALPGPILFSVKLSTPGNNFSGTVDIDSGIVMGTSLAAFQAKYEVFTFAFIQELRIDTSGSHRGIYTFNSFQDISGNLGTRWTVDANDLGASTRFAIVVIGAAKGPGATTA